MKILFATGKLNCVLSATHKIVYQIALQLQSQGHNCHICGFATDTKETVSCDEGLTVHRWNSPLPWDKAQLAFDCYVQSVGVNERENARRKYMYTHPLKSALLAYRYSPYAKPDKRAQLFAQRVKKLVQKEKFDAVIPVYMPFHEAMAVADALEGTVPLCAYQADPWGLHRDPKWAKDEAEHILQECQLFRKADHVITTPVLERMYREHPSYAPYADKLTALNFPNIRKAPQSDAQCVFDFDKNDVNILFCGLLEDGYRSPQQFLLTAEKLMEKGLPLKIHFLGTSTSKALESFCRKYPDRIVHHQAVSFDRAVATMKKADILLNISNNLDNQVPSKIFDYFSLGKAVINVQKIENCPSREYFDRYPLAYTICDYAPDVDGLGKFVTEAKGKTIDFETVRELFYDATIEYAADVTEKILAGIVEL